MKLHPLWLAAALISPAFAIDAPVDDAPPPPLLKKDKAAIPEYQRAQKGPQENEPAAKVAFLGLVTAEVPEVLAEHLRLKIGEGIMVRALMPEGPAAKSGVTVHDVILRVSGQNVGTPADLTSQVSSRKVGETIQLELIHQGQPAKVDVTLGERPPQVAASAPAEEGRIYPRAMGEDQAEQLRQLMAQRFQDPEASLQQMRESMRRAFDNTENSDIFPDRESQSDGDTQTQSQATIRVMDNQGSVEVKSRNGSKEITVHDQSGAVIWTGPWNTAEDKSAAPGQVRERISRLHIDQNFQGNGLRFKLTPGFPNQH